jgi:curved DNA-binding protein CbpA
VNELLSLDRGLALHLSDCAASGRSGIATATRRKLKRLFCLAEGRLVHAASNVIEEQLGEVLVARRLLDRASLSAALARSRERGIAVPRLLAEACDLDPALVRRVLEEHVRQMLHDTLDWPDGECRFEPGVPDLERDLTVALCPIALLADYARQRTAGTTALRARLGPPNGRPRLLPEREALLDRFECDAATRRVLECCDGAHSVSQVVAASGVGEAQAIRALYTLVLVGALELDSTDRTRETRPEGLVTRDEVLARLERSAGADFYGVLEMGPGCTRDDIRHAYYYLARRYHPDRFRAGSMVDLLPRIEAYFSHVTEAYNTLWDDEQRKAYDQLREAGAPARTEPAQDTRYLAKQNFLRAKALIEKGRRTDAVQYLSNAIQLDEGQADYHLELGRLLAGNPRRREEAERLLIRTNEIDPSRVDGYLALGDLYVKLGRREEAMRLFREVLSWEPGHIQANARLEELGAGERRGLFRG